MAAGHDPETPVPAVTMLESSISAIEHDVLRYRGVAVGELFEQAAYEEVAWLLWTGSAPGPDDRARLDADLAAGADAAQAVAGVVQAMPAQAPAVARLQAGLAL